MVQVVQQMNNMYLIILDLTNIFPSKVFNEDFAYLGLAPSPSYALNKWKVSSAKVREHP